MRGLTADGAFFLITDTPAQVKITGFFSLELEIVSNYVLLSYDLYCCLSLLHSFGSLFSPPSQK